MKDAGNGYDIVAGQLVRLPGQKSVQCAFRYADSFRQLCLGHVVFVQ